MTPADPTADTATTAATATPALAPFARELPKVLLHEHLDGGLRVSTLFELLQQRGVNPPATDVAGLAAWFEARAHAGSLVRYLEGFALTVAAMAAPAALQRVAREAAEDALSQGCVLAEFRIAPLLFEPHGVAPDAAVEAMLAGLAQSDLPCGLIVCAMRQQPVEQTLRAAELALRWHGRGVVGFDLAGPEAGFPPTMHADALARVRAAGLPITLHAGEADAAERVLEAGRLGARRIGHGVRLVDALHDPALAHQIEAVQSMDLHLEVCPTSNVHTGAVPSLALHPITALWRAGVSLSFHTDNTLMSCITLSGEAESLLAQTALTVSDLVQMQLQAAAASFMPEADKALACRHIRAWAADQGLT